MLPALTATSYDLRYRTTRNEIGRIRVTLTLGVRRRLPMNRFEKRWQGRR